MAVRFELAWKGGDGAERSVPVVGTLAIGRGDRNDIVLSVDEISWEHARIWSENDTLYIRDCGSTNGTFVNERRLRDRTSIKPGTRIRFGAHFEMLIRSREGELPSIGPSWILEDLSSGLRRPLQPTLIVGDALDADLRIAGAPRMVFEAVGDTVLYHHGSLTRSLRVGEIVEVNGIQLRLLEQRRTPPMRTARPNWEQDHYHIEATLNGRSPVATIQDDDDHILSVEGETRATLLYVLAKAVLDHRRAGLPPEQQGWLDDLEAVSKVWGKTAPSEVSNRLSVVVYRLRAGLKSAGLSANFVERHRGRVRIKAAQVSLD